MLRVYRVYRVRFRVLGAVPTLGIPLEGVIGEIYIYGIFDVIDIYVIQGFGFALSQN